MLFRSHGADSILIQRFLKEDINRYIKRSKIIESVYFYKGGIVISKGNDDVYCDQVLIAQAADTLLTMDGVTASFVISKKTDQAIGISARSLGDTNVQVVMEHLGGGGHLTNAATQLYDQTLDEAEILLKNAIDDYLEGGYKE